MAGHAKLGYFHYAENDLPEQRTAAHQQAIERATTYCGKLEASLTKLESNVAEAMIVWDEDFEQILGSVADVEHIVRCAAQTGAAAMNPYAPPYQRSSSASLHEAFKSDFFGLNEDRRSVGSRLSDVQKILAQKLRDKKLK